LLKCNVVYKVNIVRKYAQKADSWPPFKTLILKQGSRNGTWHTAQLWFIIYVYGVSSNYFHLLKSYAVDKEMLGTD